jgi:hypothetical protein
MALSDRTYRQIQASAHAAGGVTQTEATARIADITLRGMHPASLEHMLRELRREGSAAVTGLEYQPILDQQIRVREALEARVPRR